MNFLIIGVGSAGQRHLRVLSNFFNDEASIYVYRGNHKRGLISKDMRQENFSINPIDFYKAQEITVFNHALEKMWDLVIIATPPDSHFFYVKQLISVSKRILVEKPITVDLREAAEIKDLAQTYNIPVLAAYQMVFHPFYSFIKSHTNNLGKINSCSTVFIEHVSAMNPFRNMTNHYLTKATGGGAFLSLSHDLDFLLSIFNTTIADPILFTDTKFAENGSLVECKLNCKIRYETNNININQTFSILQGKTLRTGLIKGSKADISWDFKDGKIKFRDKNNQNNLDHFYSIEKDELFKLQINNILGLKDFNIYCQENLKRAKFIVEANDKIIS